MIHASTINAQQFCLPLYADTGIISVNEIFSPSRVRSMPGPLTTGVCKVMVGMEPTGHYWFNLAQQLKDQSMKIVLVNPFHVKRSKELDDNNPTKNDRKDPKTIAMLVKDGRYMEPYIPEGIYSELRTAMDTRWHIVND